MPTHEHEVIANLFLDDPSLVIDLLHDALGVFIPAGAVATLEDAALPETVPSAIEADRIVLLRRPSGDSALAVVVEVQRAQDPEKA